MFRELPRRVSNVCIETSLTFFVWFVKFYVQQNVNFVFLTGPVTSKKKKKQEITEITDFGLASKCKFDINYPSNRVGFVWLVPILCWAFDQLVHIIALRVWVKISLLWRFWQSLIQVSHLRKAAGQDVQGNWATSCLQCMELTNHTSTSYNFFFTQLWS